VSKGVGVNAKDLKAKPKFPVKRLVKALVSAKSRKTEMFKYNNLVR
jgi:hypothetical protein